MMLLEGEERIEGDKGVGQLSEIGSRGGKEDLEEEEIRRVVGYMKKKKAFLFDMGKKT